MRQVLLLVAAIFGRCAPPVPLDTSSPPDSADSSAPDSEPDSPPDTGCSPLRWYVDGDGDGWGWQDPDGPPTWVESCDPHQPGRSAFASDCGDADPAFHPHAPDPVGDGLDNDCDGQDG